LPNSRREREVVGQFANAIEDGDVDTVVALLTDDALLTMPPYPYQYHGGAATGNFLRVPFHEREVHVFRLRDGKIMEFCEHRERSEARNAVGREE
jgi:ketosteroid isomerase-like protein